VKSFLSQFHFHEVFFSPNHCLARQKLMIKNSSRIKSEFYCRFLAGIARNEVKKVCRIKRSDAINPRHYQSMSGLMISRRRLLNFIAEVRRHLMKWSEVIFYATMSIVSARFAPYLWIRIEWAPIRPKANPFFHSPSSLKLMMGVKMLRREDNHSFHATFHDCYSQLFSINEFHEHFYSRLHEFLVVAVFFGDV